MTGYILGNVEGEVVTNTTSNATRVLVVAGVVTGEPVQVVAVWNEEADHNRPTPEDVARMLADEVAKEQAAERNEWRDRRNLIRQRERLRRNPRAKGFGWVRG